MAIFSKLLLTLMCRNLCALSFLTTRHEQNSLNLSYYIMIVFTNYVKGIACP